MSPAEDTAYQAPAYAVTPWPFVSPGLTAASHAARVSAANGNAAAAAMKPVDLLLIMVARCRLRELPRFTRAGLSVAGGACALAQEQPVPACRQRSAKA